MEKNSKVYVAGHRGFVGAAIIRKLKEKEYENILVKTHAELDLTEQVKVREFFQKNKPEYVFLAAAKVGGIEANIKYPVEFLMENIEIEVNIIRSAYETGIKKLLLLGSSCIYPKDAKQPLKEEYLLSGHLESTNEGYALAKIVGLKACEYYAKQYGANYISVMPSNLYGPEDDFDLENSHVLAALIRKVHEAKVNNKPYAEIWGSGDQYREFTYIEDVADAIVYLMENYDDSEFVNIGTGEDITIRNLAQLIKEIVGYKGELRFDISKPDGMYRKVLDVARLHNLGWKHKTGLIEGIKKTYKWYLKNFPLFLKERGLGGESLGGNRHE